MNHDKINQNSISGSFATPRGSLYSNSWIHWSDEKNEVRLNLQGKGSIDTFEDGRELYDRHKSEIDAVLGDPNSRIKFVLDDGMCADITSVPAMEGLLGDRFHDINPGSRYLRVDFRHDQFNLTADTRLFYWEE